MVACASDADLRRMMTDLTRDPPKGGAIKVPMIERRGSNNRRTRFVAHLWRMMSDLARDPLKGGAMKLRMIERRAHMIERRKFSPNGALSMCGY